MAAFEFTEWSVSRAKKAPLLRFLVDGLKAAGCTILWVSEPTRAPFLITFETLLGERHGVLAYVFFANSKLTKNRPPDEHRFQVKYGSDEHATLPVECDPSQLVTTIFVGIDIERGILVGADPVLHDGTPMYISIEFKRPHAEAIQATGWHAWERQSRRRDGEPVEVLVGVKQERVLDLIRFERLAFGLDAGHRQLLAERMLSAPSHVSTLPSPHALTKELQLSETAVLDLIQGARRLKMAVRGWVAEHHLERFLQQVPGVVDCKRIDEEGAPDIRLRFNGSRPILVECKNVLRKRDAEGRPRVDFQRTRASKEDSCSRYYRPEDFHVLAACLHAVTEEWEYRFVPTIQLPPHKSCLGRIRNTITVDSDWSDDPIPTLISVATK